MALTYTNGGGAFTYVNTISDGSCSTSNLGGITANTIVGNDPGTAGRFLSGYVDDITIYNRALSLTELQADYELSLQGYPGTLNRMDPMLYGPSSVVSGGFFSRYYYDIPRTTSL